MPPKGMRRPGARVRPRARAPAMVKADGGGAPAVLRRPAKAEADEQHPRLLKKGDWIIGTEAHYYSHRGTVAGEVIERAERREQKDGSSEAQWHHHRASTSMGRPSRRSQSVAPLPSRLPDGVGGRRTDTRHREPCSHPRRSGGRGVGHEPETSSTSRTGGRERGTSSSSEEVGGQDRSRGRSPEREEREERRSEKEKEEKEEPRQVRRKTEVKGAEETRSQRVQQSRTTEEEGGSPRSPRSKSRRGEIGGSPCSGGEDPETQQLKFIQQYRSWSSESEDDVPGDGPWHCREAPGEGSTARRGDS